MVCSSRKRRWRTPTELTHDYFDLLRFVKHSFGHMAHRAVYVGGPKDNAGVMTVSQDESFEKEVPD